MNALRSLVLVAALLAALVAPTTSHQASAAPEATLSDAVVDFLDGSPLSATMEVIVTFHDRSGVARLMDMGLVIDQTRTLPMALATLTPKQILDVATWPVTRSVWENATYDWHLSDSIGMIKADQVWAGQGLDTGYTGAGVGVAIMDSGIDGTHPDVSWGDNLKANFLILANPLGAGPAQFIDQPITSDDHGHGTHVAGTVAGTGAASDGLFTGVAPEADLWGFKIGTASVFAWFAIQGFDWVLTEGAEHNVRVINNSWGGGGGSDHNPDDPVDVASKRMYDNDIVVVFAAGNSGSPNTIGRNAVSPHVVSVAAANKDFTKAGFSSTGRPSGDLIRDDNGIYRPTVAAPGVDIAAPRSSTGAQMSDSLLVDHPEYTVASGTSMASPHVAGVVALMLEANPDLTAQNVIDILECTAAPMPGYTPWEVGAGFVDALAAVQWAEQGRTSCDLDLVTLPYEHIEGNEFAGLAPPAGYALYEQGDHTLAETFEVEIGEDVDLFMAEISWLVPAENIYLFLLDPEGNEVESSAGLLDAPIDFRRVVTTHPTPGTWTILVVGRTNAATDFTGAYNFYRYASEQCDVTRDRTTQTFEDTISYGANLGAGEGVSIPILGDAKFFEFDVPGDAESVTVQLDWEDGSQDLDMYIYGPDGSEAGRAASENHPESTSLEGDDPITGGLTAGTYEIEVHGWLVTSPQDFVVTTIITTAEVGECVSVDLPAGDTPVLPAPDDDVADTPLPATGGSAPIVLALLMLAAAAAMRRRVGLGVVADR